MNMENDSIGIASWRLKAESLEEQVYNRLRRKVSEDQRLPHYLVGSEWFVAKQALKHEKFDEFQHYEFTKEAPSYQGCNRFLDLTRLGMSECLPYIDAGIVFLQQGKQYTIKHDLMVHDSKPLVYEYLQNGWEEISMNDDCNHLNNDGRKYRLYKYQFYHKELFPKGKSTFLLAVDTSLPEQVIAANNESIKSKMLYALNELKRMVGEGNLQLIAINTMLPEKRYDNKKTRGEMIDTAINTMLTNSYIKKMVLTDWSYIFLYR